MSRHCHSRRPCQWPLHTADAHAPENRCFSFRVCRSPLALVCQGSYSHCLYSVDSILGVPRIFKPRIEPSFLWNVGYYSRVWKGSPHRRAGISPIFSRSGVNFSLSSQKLRLAPLRGACKNLLSLFQERGDFIGVAAFALMPRGCSYQGETALSPTMNLSIFSNIVWFSGESLWK